MDELQVDFGWCKINGGREMKRLGKATQKQVIILGEAFFHKGSENNLPQQLGCTSVPKISYNPDSLFYTN